ncbi:hypothetical protein [Leptolyngbya ohadii]|uniref:hypothetical protein n=1 Tax=Leptolyngbya ohadii TaxID=1962290 RepID=UPI000B599CB1|nr:hypothetical protein [Leptolyngbya ohadii]
MNIDEQIQVLVDEASRYGIEPTDIDLIAPVLRSIAEQLQHPQYYVLQNLEQQWLMTTLADRTQPEVTKTVLHAFPSLEAAKASTNALNDFQLVASPIPTVHLLFQMLAMKPIDSIVFLETSANLQSGKELSRQNLQTLIEQHLLRQRSANIPPDIA